MVLTVTNFAVGEVDIQLYGKRMAENVSSPTEEIGLWDKSKPWIDIKYNTALPDVIEKISSPAEDAGLQDKSEFCINIKYNTAPPFFIENISLSKEATGLRKKSELCIDTKVNKTILHSTVTEYIAS